MYSKLGYDALVYVLPLIEMGTVRARAVASGQTINQFSHLRTLSNARSRAVTTPNNDTLYSTAWLDLSDPLEIELPEAGDRYFSLALMDAYSNNFAVLRAADQGGVGRVRVTARQGSKLPAIVSPTRMVWALARTSVSAPSDLAAAHELQDRLIIVNAAAGAAPLQPLGRRNEIAETFNFANRLMADNAPFSSDHPILERLGLIGVGPGLSFPPSSLSEQGIAEIEAGAQAALHDMSSEPALPINGWIYPEKSIGNFGTDYVNRARVALTGLAALPMTEAIYLKGGGDDDTANCVFDGARPHQISVPDRFTKSDHGFWSLSLYQSTPEGQLFFFDNPLDRYSIGSNTPNLIMAHDGSYPITISAQRPVSVVTNWLPAPLAPYRLQFRLFRPALELMVGSLPPVLPI